MDLSQQVGVWSGGWPHGAAAGQTTLQATLATWPSLPRQAGSRDTSLCSPPELRRGRRPSAVSAHPQARRRPVGPSQVYVRIGTYGTPGLVRVLPRAALYVGPRPQAPGPRPRAPERAAQGLRYTRYVRGWYTAPCVRHGCGMVHVSTEPGTVVITRLYRAKVGMVMPTCSRGETWSCSAPRVRVMHHAMLHHYHAMSCTLTRRRQ